MRKLVVLAALFGSSLSWAGVDTLFPKGMPGAEWGISLAALRQLHPEGFLNPISSSAIPYLFIVPGPHKELGLHVPIKAASYAFDRNEHLRVVYVQIDSSDVDFALHDVAEVLGEDYTTQDDNRGRKYQWKPGHTTRAQMEIAGPTPRSWVNLVITNASDTTVVADLKRCE